MEEIGWDWIKNTEINEMYITRHNHDFAELSFRWGSIWELVIEPPLSLSFFSSVLSSF